MSEDMESTTISLSIVRVAVAFLVGILLLSGFTAGLHISSTSVDTIHFTQQPTDGGIVTIDSHVFEFDNGDGVADGHIAVLIGESLTETSENLATAIAVYYNTA